MQPYPAENEPGYRLEKFRCCCCFELNVKTAALIIIILDLIGMMIFPGFTLFLVISGSLALYSIIRDHLQWARRCYLWIKLISAILAIVLGILLLCGIDFDEPAITKFNEYGGGVVFILVGLLSLYFCWVFREIINILETEGPTADEKRRLKP
eukprot:TRINITY_DN0_c1279_g1_i1.p1 TRINITY_DN0_c1279_g1~~TRINITY_DN0_c1279_g1_i1.p1  ORF type:complete len:153 (+),score=34.73 TRINITY_DN0_c1279_g1_i1:47-505(+)